MTRIYYPHPPLMPNSLMIEGKQAHYLLNVLRVKTGEHITLFDGQNKEYDTQVSKVDKKSLSLTIISEKNIQRESPFSIHLIQGISKGERMDWVMQKATELGVSRITPIYTQHNAVSLKQEHLAKKHDHWKNIIISACEQCGRNRLPVCDSVQSFGEAMAVENNDGLKWILDTDASPNKIPPNPPLIKGGTDRSTIIIGPEGGFSASEITQAHDAGFTSVSLGPRILRTETAAIAIIASLQAILGDLLPSPSPALSGILSRRERHHSVRSSLGDTTDD